MIYKILQKQYNTDMCFVCGMKNESGVQAAFYDCEKEDGERVLLSVVEPKELHHSFPNRMHGGIISGILDEAMGRAVKYDHPDMWAVTVDLSTRYKNPTPLDQTLYAEGRITEITSRTFSGEAKLFLKDGTVCATATGRFFIVPFEKAFTKGVTDETWFVVEDGLETIEI